MMRNVYYFFKSLFRAVYSVHCSRAVYSVRLSSALLLILKHFGSYCYNIDKPQCIYNMKHINSNLYVNETTNTLYD